jgi:hypothetical protein
VAKTGGGDDVYQNIAKNLSKSTRDLGDSPIGRGVLGDIVCLQEPSILGGAGWSLVLDGEQRQLEVVDEHLDAPMFPIQNQGRLSSSPHP